MLLYPFLYSSEYDTWEPRGSLHPELITEYEKQNGCYDYDWQHRCPTCDLPFSSNHAVRIHLGRYHKAPKAQDFSQRLADKAVQKEKRRLQQADRLSVECEGEKLENVYNFLYLGSDFAADGNQEDDIKRRKALATARCGRLRHIFDSEKLSLDLKLRLYKAAVCSVLIYGCESWILTDKTRRSINNINSLLLSRITGNAPQIEARPVTTSHNLIRQIRIIRYKYLDSS